jgi:hypothetical protein
MNIAKILYKDDRNALLAFNGEFDKNYRKIPAVVEIRELLNEASNVAKKTPPKVSRSEKELAWESAEKTDIYDVLYHLKSLADRQTHNPRKNRSREGNKRSEYTIGKSYRKFLMLAFLCCIPPDRQEFLRNLEIGESFVWGEIRFNEVIPAEKMKDPSKARWVLGATDGKTYEDYGFQPYYLPNHEFFDGTYLYDYVNRWIEHFRPIYKPKTSHLFFKIQANIPLDHHSVYDIIRRTIEGFTGSAIGPHYLRTLFNSYLSNYQVQPQLKTNMRKRQMRHSDEIAEECYVIPDVEIIDQPTWDFMQDLLMRSGDKNLSPNTLSKNLKEVLKLIPSLTTEEREITIRACGAIGV